MNIEIQNDGDKMIVKVSLVPYDVGRREPRRIREVFNLNMAYESLIKEGHIGYVPYEGEKTKDLDNKFTHTSGTFVFVKEKKLPVKKKQVKKSHNRLDNKEEDMIRSIEKTVE